MVVEPQSGLEVQLKDVELLTEQGGRYYREISDLLDVLWGYVRQTVIDWYFRYGVLPPTWIELEGRSA